MISHISKKIVWITIFSIAMGLLESAVVIYLRELYYPSGFAFPLKIMSITIALTELLREAATLLMLVAIGILVGRTKSEKFGFFIYSFAIWDVFYYLFLKMLIHWPETWLTWDVLFLLPTTWVGPVFAPILISSAMIVFGLTISYFTDRNKQVKIAGKEWIILIAGSVVVILSFTLEYSQYMMQKFSLNEIVTLHENILAYASQFVPINFPLSIFWVGFAIILFSIGMFILRNSKTRHIL